MTYGISNKQKDNNNNKKKTNWQTGKFKMEKEKVQKKKHK